MRGFERPASQTGCSSGLHLSCRQQDLFFVLDRARPGDHANVSAAERERPGFDNRRFLACFPAGDLVGSEDRQHLFDLVARLEFLLGTVPFIADGGHDGPLRPGDDMGFQPEAFPRATIRWIISEVASGLSTTIMACLGRS